MGDHSKALQILVHNLGDHQAAERYCDRISEGKDEKARQRLFLSLLTTYLEARPGENQGRISNDFFRIKNAKAKNIDNYNRCQESGFIIDLAKSRRRDLNPRS